MAEIKLKIASVVIGSGEGGGSGVAPYYADLPDKPTINGETLSGTMTSEDLGLASESQAVPSGGTTGQVLAKKSNADNDVQWVNQEDSGTDDYADLTNKPQINSVALSGNKSASDLGLATANQGSKADTAVQPSEMASAIGAVNPFAGEVNATDAQRNQALANVSNQTANATTGKMGYKVLDPTKTFAEQVIAENTIYEIRDVFDLGSTQETPVSVTLPAGCTLKFNGGKIFNGEILYQNTCIEGDATMEVDIAQGSSIKGSIVCCEWFGLKVNDNTFDNGIIINKVLNRFKNVIIQQKGTYYAKTPIVGDNIKYINFLGSFTYNGSNNTNFAVITVQNSDKAEIYINQISAYNSDIDFDNFGKTTSIRGLDVINCTNSSVSVSNMSFLNEGIRLMGYGSTGQCVYNTVHDCNLQYVNVAIRVTQDVDGWANENYFHRIRHITYSDFDKDAVLFLVYGPKWEDNTNNTDTYNTCNGIVIKECSCENNKYGTNTYANLFNNVTRSTIHISRAEQCRTVCMFVGSSKNNDVNVVYSGTGRDFDYTELVKESGPITYNRLSLSNIETIAYSNDLVYKTGSNFAVKGMYLINQYGAVYSTSKQDTPSKHELVLDSDYKPTFNVNGENVIPAFKLRNQGYGMLYVSASVDCRLMIKYLTAIVNGTEQNISNKNYNVGGIVKYGMQSGVVWTEQADNNGYWITVPSDIRDFYIGLYKSNAADFNYTLRLRGIKPLFRREPLSGTFANAPTNVPAGYIYQAIDLDKAILWDGTAWTNLDGTALV